MKTRTTLFLTVLTVMASLIACKDEPSQPAEDGRITAQVTAIPDQNGNTYSVVAYDYDWQPGATGPIVAGFMQQIDSDNFSSTQVLQGVDATGRPTGQEKVFTAGTYSVVFFVSLPGQPPAHFAELRVTVDGDVQVSAPAWNAWTHL